MSDKAFEYAVDLANMNSDKNKLKTEIILLHVVPEIPITNLLFERPIRTRKSKGIVNLSDYVTELYQQIEEGMREILEKKRENAKLMRHLHKLEC